MMLYGAVLHGTGLISTSGLSILAEKLGIESRD